MPNMSKLNAVHFFTCVIATTLFSLSAMPGAFAQAIGEDEQLVAAERALLEGLSAHGGGAFQAQAEQPQAPQVELQPATYSGPVNQPQAHKASPTDQAPPTDQLEEHDIPVHVEQKPKVISQPKPQRIREAQDSQEEVAAAAPAAQHPNAALKRELEVSQKRVTELERQLEEVKGQLTMAETELSRLATISEARNRASLGHVPAAPAAHLPTQGKAAVAREETPHIEPTPASSTDLTIATVAVEKAELRLGPGKNHSALMTVAKGSRLAVEARQGEWLRVFAPNGQRAWILSKLVAFGTKAGSNSTSTVRVRGYSSSLEDAAFRRVQSLTESR